jgi:hypothetical protein
MREGGRAEWILLTDHPDSDEASAAARETRHENADTSCSHRRFLEWLQLLWKPFLRQQHVQIRHESFDSGPVGHAGRQGRRLPCPTAAIGRDRATSIPLSCGFSALPGQQVCTCASELPAARVPQRTIFGSSSAASPSSSKTSIVPRSAVAMMTNQPARSRASSVGPRSGTRSWWSIAL